MVGGGRNGCRRRPLVGAVLGAALASVVLAAGCAVPPPFSFVDPSKEAAVLTRVGRDVHRVEAADGGVTVRAADGNTSGNDRLVITPAGAAPLVDQESCATWSGGTGVDFRQEGAALRVATEGGATRAITVTKNVWGSVFWVVNVHVWDTSVPSTDTTSPATFLAGFDLHDTLVRGGSLVSFPWRLCARAEGDVVSFVVWPAGEARPAWGDPAHGGGVRLPAGWVYAGRPGWYAGHLWPGATLAYRETSAGGVTPEGPTAPDGPPADPVAPGSAVPGLPSAAPVPPLP